MSDRAHSPPNLLNAVILCAQAMVIAVCITAMAVGRGPWLLAVGALFIIAMNSVYFMIHEAQHGVLFSNRRLNDLAGVGMSLFMPASFSLIRRVHLAHHIHNRSDEEAFDIYCENDSVLWRKLQFFGILTGAFWLTMVIGNFALALLPMRWISRVVQFDRPSAAVMRYLDRHNDVRIRLESCAAILLHAAIILCLGPRWPVYAVLYAAFGISWSTLQYVHHYGTTRDVLRGTKNLRYGSLLDFLWLHHGWHLTHHLHPTASWVYLPRLATDDQRPTESLARAYLRMWRGPLRSTEHMSNRYDGDVGQT